MAFYYFNGLFLIPLLNYCITYLFLSQINELNSSLSKGISFLTLRTLLGLAKENECFYKRGVISKALEIMTTYYKSASIDFSSVLNGLKSISIHSNLSSSQKNPNYLY